MRIKQLLLFNSCGTFRPAGFLLAAGVLMALTPRLAVAGPIYELRHDVDAFGPYGPIINVGPQSTPIDYDYTYQFTGWHYSEALVDINPGSIGISARTTHVFIQPARQEVTGKFFFDVIFSSSGSDPIDVIMNMTLSGLFSQSGPTDLVEVTSGASSGRYYANTPPEIPAGILSNFVPDGTDQTISTNVIANVPVNVAVQFEMQLFTGQRTEFLTNTALFDLSLSRTGDVFTILGPNAGDVTGVNSEDANIFNNRFGQPNPVPEPSSLALFVVGFMGMFVFGIRRWNAA